LFGFPNKLVPIEICASQRREKISRLDKAGIVDDPPNTAVARAE
jgi:hypothetical protein